MDNNIGAAIDMFDFQNVMDDYYRSKPKDDAGKAAKRTFQSNMVQSAFDAQLAAAQAEKAQEYDLDARRTTADLELSNQLQLMKRQINMEEVCEIKSMSYKIDFQRKSKNVN